MNKELLKTVVTQHIEQMDTSEIVAIWNEYCSAGGYMDNYIHRMDDFDEIMGGMKPWEIARACYYSNNFCPAHEYFWFNGYGNLESADTIWGGTNDKSPVYIPEITAYIADEEDALYNDEIQEILDDFEKEDY